MNYGVMKKYNKLVRDRISDILKKKGLKYKIHIAGKKEYWKKLKEKLLEEIKEFSKSETIEEFADILEVLDAVKVYKKFDKRKIETIKKKKAKERGSFKKRTILEES